KLYFVFVYESFKRERIEPLHLGERIICFGRAGMGNHGFELVGECVPGLERNDAFAGAVRLVEPGIIIERRNAIEPERYVGAGTDEFGAIDDAGLQAHKDLGRRRSLRRNAKPAIDLTAEAKRSQLETAQVDEALHFAPEPAPHADAGVAAHERLHAEGCVEFVPQSLSSAG